MGALGIDQGHSPAHQPERIDQAVRARGHDIDDRVADGDHVGSGCGHGNSLALEGLVPARLAGMSAQGKVLAR